MFSHKQNKAQSTSKLIKLLTRRASANSLKTKGGVFSDWPGQNKPSIMNSTNFLNIFNNNKEQKKKSLNQKLKKQAASFSTCTTIQFYPQNHLSKIATPQIQEKQTLNETIDQNYLQEQQSGDIQMNSKYGEDLSFQKTKKTSQKNKIKREIKTACVTRHIIQDQNKIGFGQKKYQNILRKSKSALRPKSTKNPFLRLNQEGSNLNQSSVSTLISYRIDGHQHQFQQPLRLKDYQTNFQAYKLMSKLIDQQMKWEPKRKRPKTSVKYRTYKF